MDQQPVSQSTRRNFLLALLALPMTLWLAACRLVGGDPAPAPAAQVPPTIEPPTPAPASPTATQPAPANTPTAVEPPPTDTPIPPEPVAALAPTPACGDDDDEPTLAQTEGPYYTPNTPERASLLEPGLGGTKLVVTGYVLSTDCQPVAAALLDFWQADNSGQYDNVGYRLRGHQFSDDQGRFTLETIVPGLYPGRTRHIHVRVQPPHQPILTTQLYFPDEPANATDGIFDPELVMAVQGEADGQTASFNFVVTI